MTGTVYVVDDEKLVRHHLSLILTTAGYTAKCFASGEDFLATKIPIEPACLLLDINLLGGMDGPSLQDQLRRRRWPVAIIYVTAHATIPMAVKAVKGGALDILTKPIERQLLLTSVAKALVAAHETHQKRRDLHENHALVQQITAREREVLTWLIAGKLNKEIAYLLGITERTVKAHRANIMEKLGAVSIVDLVRIADKAGIQPGRE